MSDLPTSDNPTPVPPPVEEPDGFTSVPDDVPAPIVPSPVTPLGFTSVPDDLGATFATFDQNIKVWLRLNTRWLQHEIELSRAGVSPYDRASQNP